EVEGAVGQGGEHGVGGQLGQGVRVALGAQGAGDGVVAGVSGEDLGDRTGEGQGGGAVVVDADAGGAGLVGAVAAFAFGAHVGAFAGGDLPGQGGLEGCLGPGGAQDQVPVGVEPFG